MVERTSWYELCAQMMTLLHVLGVADPSSARPQLRPLPDRELLEEAAARARGVFGLFARADISLLSVRALPSSHQQPAAELRRSSAKRRRDENPPLRATDATTTAATATATVDAACGRVCRWRTADGRA